MYIYNAVYIYIYINTNTREKFSNQGDTFKRVIGILVNLCILTAILTRTARAILVKIPVNNSSL